MGKKFLTRLGVLAAASATILTVTPLAANAAPSWSPNPTANGVKPSSVHSDGAQRISGMNRYEVSVNGAKQAIKDGRATGSTFVLASGSIWTDAVSAATLSGSVVAKAPVLLVKQGSLTPEVATYLSGFKGKTTRVFISGGPATISDAVVAQVKAILPGVKVSRNGGADRTVVSYNNAAETVGYRIYGSTYSGSLLGNGHFTGGNEILFRHDKLQFDTEAEAAYQAALVNYNKAYAAQGAAQDAYNAAVAKVAALNKQISDQVAKLQQVPAASQAAFDAAYKQVLDDSAALKQAQADAVFLNTLGTVTTSTGKLPSTLGDYRPLLNASQNAQLSAVQGRIGATDSTTLNAALGLANTKIDAANATLLTSQTKLAEATAALQAAAAAEAANKPIIDQIGQLGAQLKPATDAATAAKDALKKANGALFHAKQDLATATWLRPKSGWEARDAAALDAARDAAIKAAGRSRKGINAFLATGSVFTDALSVGPAAAANNGVVLLTKGASLGPSALRWKTNYGTADGQYIAVGGEAIKAAGNDATYTVPGADRYAVSVAVSQKFFTGRVYASVASGEISSDATSAGSFSAAYNNPLVLTKGNTLPYVVDNFLRNTNQTVRVSAAVVFGGPATIDAPTFTAIQSAVMGK